MATDEFTLKQQAGRIRRRLEEITRDADAPKRTSGAGRASVGGFASNGTGGQSPDDEDGNPINEMLWDEDDWDESVWG